MRWAIGKRSRQADNGLEGSTRFTASMIVAGQIKGMEPRLFMVYSEGNFIEASFDTPFFQIWKWPTNLRYDRFFKGIR